MSEEQWTREFAKRLLHKMKSEGVDQRRLSMLSGISESSISKYISGHRSPKLYSIIRIARALDATIYELIPITR